jgi:antitoxin YqcF
VREPAEFERQLGRHIRAQLGAKTKVVRYGDDDGRQDVFLVSALDVPCAGVTTFGTVGLSNRSQQFHDKEVFVEVLGACASATSRFDNLIASCAFASLKGGTSVVYGGIIENILDQYQLSARLRHVTFVAPFLWAGFEPFDVQGKQIHWLAAVPISDAELKYLREEGIDALEDLFEKNQINLYDIDRRSAL